MTHRLMSRAMVMSSIMHGMDPSMHDGCGRRSQRRFFFRGISPPQDLLAAVLFSLHTWHDPWARHAKVHGGG